MLVLSRTAAVVMKLSVSHAYRWDPRQDSVGVLVLKRLLCRSAIQNRAERLDIVATDCVFLKLAMKFFISTLITDPLP